MDRPLDALGGAVGRHPNLDTASRGNRGELLQRVADCRGNDVALAEKPAERHTAKASRPAATGRAGVAASAPPREDVGDDGVERLPDAAERLVRPRASG